jgi:hypothetical protein
MVRRSFFSYESWYDRADFATTLLLIVTTRAMGDHPGLQSKHRRKIVGCATLALSLGLLFGSNRKVVRAPVAVLFRIVPTANREDYLLRIPQTGYAQQRRNYPHNKEFS